MHPPVQIVGQMLNQTFTHRDPIRAILKSPITVGEALVASYRGKVNCAAAAAAGKQDIGSGNGCVYAPHEYRIVVQRILHAAAAAKKTGWFAAAARI
jgi:hypothetical protein